MRKFRNDGALIAFVICWMSAVGGIAQDTNQSVDGEAALEKSVRPFLNTYCLRCHNAKRASSGFRVDELTSAFGVGKTADHWKEVMDKINLGEMPPEDEPQPTPAEFQPVVKWINAQLRNAELEARNAGGRIPMRRLNRSEYTNTVRDLLYLDPKILAPLVEELPGDGKAEGFDRLGVALFFDETQIERTLAVAERIAEIAIVDDQPETHATRFEFEDNARVKGYKAKTKSRFAKTLVDAGPAGSEIIDGGVRFVHGYGNRSKEFPWGRLGGIGCQEVITQDGYYRIRIRVGGDAGSRGEPIKIKAVYAANTPVECTTEIPVRFSLEEPDVAETVVFLRSGPEGLKRGINFYFNDITDLIVSTPENNQFFRELRTATSALRDAKAGESADEIEAAQKSLDEVRARATEWKGPLRYYNPERDHKNPPTIFVDWVEVSGPVVPNWPPKSHKSIFFAGDDREDISYAREIFTRLMPRAYRRPVSSTEIERVVQLVASAHSKDASFHEAVREGLVHVLCSPGFLFIQEPASADESRNLNEYELASRLSYFLWGSMPDDELFELSKTGRLRDEQVLMSQVDRMLDDPKSEALVEGFAGQWLNVREFGSIMPAAEYRDHYDAELEEASRLEAYAFFREILAKNLPISNFLDSDFVMINERLAKHYGIEDVQGAQIRRVEIEPHHHRGGVLGMAGLMTWLSDGTRTLPVRRAAWVKTQLFGDPPGNPPPDAGEIQPNTAGKNLTVRQRLDMHRNEATCASCHTTLDPFGLALENYDAIGMWRTKANGEGFRANKAPELHVGGVFPNGEAFASLAEYKVGLTKRKDPFTQNVVKQFLTYALTRPIGYTDHPTVDAIAEAVKADDYRIRTLIRETVRSQLFQSK